MNSTRLIYSNEKGRFDLPPTTVLWPDAPPSGDTAHPVVFHPASGKASIGIFPTADLSDCARLSQNNLFTGVQVVQIGDYTGIYNAISHTFHYLDPATNVTTVADMRYDGPSDTLNLEAREIIVPEPLNGNNPATVNYVDALVSGATSGLTGGGDTVISFTQEVGKFTLITSEGSFVVDLNTPATKYIGNQILRDPEFNLPFAYQADGYNIPGWDRSDNWAEVNGQAVLSPGGGGQFLYQDVDIPATAMYEVSIVISSIGVSNSLVCYVGNAPTMREAGTYTFFTTLAAGRFRFHLRGNPDTQNYNNITLDSCTLRQVQVGAVYGDDKFVHLTGDESIGGAKTLTGSIAIDSATQRPLTMATSAPNADIVASFIAPNAPTVAAFAVGRSLAGVGNAALLGYRTDNGAAFITTFGRGLDDFVVGTNGNVGIGTGAPQERLEVVGKVKTEGIHFADGTIQTTAAVPEFQVDGGNQPIYVNNQGYLDIARGDGIAFDADSSTLTLNFIQDLAQALDSQVPTSSAIRRYVAAHSSTTAPAQISGFTYTVTAVGAQTITLPQPATDLRRVQLLESGTTTATREIWEPYCTISGATLTITADAAAQPGDKIFLKYTY